MDTRFRYELKVFILYGNAVDGDRAFELYLWLQQSLGGEMSIQGTLCKIGLLADPKLGGDALQNASEAHLLLVCAGSTAPLPMHFLQWLDRLPNHKGYLHPAIAVVAEDNPGKDLVIQQLRSLAQSKGFDFVSEAGPEGAQPLAVSHATLRARQGLLAEHHETGYLHWGINE